MFFKDKINQMRWKFIVSCAKDDSVHVPKNSKSETVTNNVDKIDCRVDSGSTDILIDEKDVENILASQTPLQRLRYMFVCDINGSPSFEKSVIQCMPLMVFGAITFVNIYLKAPEYAQEFIKIHKATAWPTKLVAKRKFNDFVISKAFAFGAKRGFKIAFLSTSFLLLQWSLHAYRGKSSWWETSFSCATVGALYCFDRGLKGMVAGGLIGGIPGLTIGPAIYWLQKTNHMTYEEVNRRKVVDFLKEKKAIEEAMRIE